MQEVIIDLDKLGSVARDQVLYCIQEPENLVRCQNCVRAVPWENGRLRCLGRSVCVPPDHFCGYGIKH